MAAAVKRTTPKALTIGEIAIRLAEELDGGDVIFAAEDEVSALAITTALIAAATEALVLFCPSSDALPGDNSPASPANAGRRVSTLRSVRLALSANERPRIALVTTGEALGRLFPAPSAFDAAPPRVTVGAQANLAELFASLEDLGYLADDRVDEPGEIALRGQVLDVFPADADAPIRIETTDGVITSVRIYDPADQRTTGDCQERELGRAAEPSIGSSGVTLLEHLPTARIALAPGAEERRRRFLMLAHDATRRRSKRALSDVTEEKAWIKALEARETFALPDPAKGPPRFVESSKPLQTFTKAVKLLIAEGSRIVLLGGKRDLRYLTPRVANALKSDVRLVSSWKEVKALEAEMVVALAMPVDRGFVADTVVAIAAADLIGSRAERPDPAASADDLPLLSSAAIRLGDVVIHEDHGIAIVAGLEPMPPVDGAESGDAIKLSYAAGGVRLVPVDEADRIWRYGAEEDAVTLDKLDGGSWEKRRVTIDAAIAESARGLTQLAAERARRTAPQLVPDEAAYERFAAGFPFSETPDQTRAIAAVRVDLASGQPMDRLVIGDVGYGKTEVALQAAALAALAGSQVAVAAPTTVLARQHLESFAERFEGTGITVAGLSRLSTAAEKKRVKAGLVDGSIRIVVGTGAIAAKGIAYQNLALVVIDEEQRFGAADKARMRKLGSAHVLTLSATPIPRTLQTAMVGLQQLSVIATPPARRQPIRTSVGQFEPETVRTALFREKSRGGQSFVVVPRIEDMAPLATQLAAIVPELDLLQAHGKMPALEIDDAMVRFGRGDGDILLATNIIEAGLDVPRANTMVIWRADRFGLSQLHQLRGRVGRGGRRGQVMLLTEPAAEIAPRTLKRLRTLEAFDRLGAGFAISARDLDMRGAGDLLGEAQAGHMKLIGVDLYQHLLEAALRMARGETVERWNPDLNLGLQGRFPAEWVPDVEVRISLYCRLARIDNEGELDDFTDELEDRFGGLPPDVHALLQIARIRLAAKALRISKIDAGPAAIALTPRTDFVATVDGLVRKGDRLILSERMVDPIERTTRVERLLDALEPA